MSDRRFEVRDEDEDEDEVEEGMDVWRVAQEEHGPQD